MTRMMVWGAAVTCACAMSVMARSAQGQAPAPAAPAPIDFTKVEITTTKVGNAATSADRFVTQAYTELKRTNATR